MEGGFVGVPDCVFLKCFTTLQDHPVLKAKKFLSTEGCTIV